MTTRSTAYWCCNRTLGFHRIFVLNTPARMDRRRTMEAQRQFHGLSFEYAQTVGHVEANWHAKESGYLINGTHLACYLSHLNIYKRMVEEDIESALVLEDDIDTEVDLRDRHSLIMAQVGKEYGGDWDMLFVGHCTSDVNEPGSVLRPRAATGGNSRVGISPGDRAAYLQRNVTLYVSEYPMCLHAYALTKACAKRLAMVLEERLKTVGQEIDLVLAIGVEFGVSTVLGVSPPYIVQVGRTELGSDLTSPKGGDTAQRLARSTLFHLGLRLNDPQSLAPYIDWEWFTAQQK
ncbi:hypothetical protein EV174_004020 [Coemansia sp. RSA 2320]|nr:hypothetical protein EV174_004020 [Coemansia sp. RSA 2320]